MTDHYLKQYADAGLYVMQNRLSPPENGRFQSFPRASWAAEIEAAPRAGLRGIEWIFDLYGEGANPLETAEGRSELRDALKASGVSVVSICADYFMDCPLVRVDTETFEKRLATLKWLISICPEMGVTRVVLPFVDASKMVDSNDKERVLSALHTVLPDATAAAVELHLEADFNPQDFRAFLAEIDSPLVKVNYDAGNSASLGFAPAREFEAYGDRVGSFHIKDRVKGGFTVPLGTGDADFAALRAALIDVDYRGDFVLQVARGEPGDEVAWLRKVSDAACAWLRGDTPDGRCTMSGAQ
ncbi:xylose isomerase [Burkholderia ubonensis]|uniref:sugar phosphate isomerase/epimerase family protein n=1 Tax=Burkholderia ubonensis TaxID=101571 RepID=UPI000754B7C4|nr:sugar phosphate isomerase/epimerase [Burkholderia ubonensis]KVN58770.1 xylose isomerase [Burkholderia ubonensis]KVR34923.1 xylose isomerase [Burkholderia ubonensis]KVT51576.1 xylose isomerase [Burkholderia ubonensis]KWI10060.1 xylose isomerase [Burkholderia ubonensis]KWI30769.1 xylose isomerase [Burkholderia ubonensis]